ncbi:heptaprenyl diphosphate synthase component 1 [Cohnella soli]|uniref:Heptaprenyl diphosphate synthase component 1 n=1 Tax=Cohnella soli TaxID=425005 RepID=A0ABW0HUI9_9BACL
MSTAKIDQMAGKYMNHDMINLHTDLPEFPQGRVSLLYAVLQHQPEAAKDKQLFALVTSLVQMGLDTHEMVDNAPSGIGGVLGMRAQQLKVLAGDYFSSRFYHLLSQAGQIDVVRRLSEAVCQVNRLKMIFYSKTKQMKMDAEEYLHYGAELRSGLFLSFTGFMSGLYERLWPEILNAFSRCEVLMNELGKVEKGAFLDGSWGMWHIMQEGSEDDRRMLTERREDTGMFEALLSKYDVAEKLDGLLRQATAQLQTTLQRLQSDTLLSELQPIIEPFAQAGKLRAAVLKELGQGI